MRALDDPVHVDARQVDVIGVKFTTKPGEQWTIRRDAYQRIRDAFEANGIIFAQRNVKVEVVGERVRPVA